MRLCVSCEAPLMKRKGEAPSGFDRRSYCSKDCAKGAQRPTNLVSSCPTPKQAKQGSWWAGASREDFARVIAERFAG
jgi:hypothetical protein